MIKMDGFYMGYGDFYTDGDIYPSVLDLTKVMDESDVANNVASAEKTAVQNAMAAKIDITPKSGNFAAVIIGVIIIFVIMHII